MITEPESLLPEETVSNKKVILPSKILLYALVALVSIGIGGYSLYSMYAPVESPLTIAEVTTEKTTLGFTPGEISGAVGETKSVDLIVNSGSEKLIGAEVTISYNPSQIEIISASLGTHLATKVQEPTVSEESGTIKFISMAEYKGVETGVTGQGTLATIRLKIKAAGELSIHSNTQTAIASQSTNSLGTTQKATIKIAEAQASPTAEPSNNPTLPKTTLKTQGDPTCTNITLSWDKINGAQGYVLELSPKSDFSEGKLTSGQIGSDRSNFTFTGLKGDTTYYSRITLAGINNYPQFSNTVSTKTKNCNIVSNTTTTSTNNTQPTQPKTTAPVAPRQTATPRPPTAPTPTTNVGSTTPTPALNNQGTTVGDSYGDFGSEDYQDYDNYLAETEESERPMSFVQWIWYQIGRLFGRD
jgi:hypothetical protein